MILFLLASFVFGDVKQVENAVDAPGKRLVFTEDLRFGGVEEDEDHYLWMDHEIPVNLEADPAGRIYVVDPQNQRILQFSKEGKFLKQIGGPGQGPGEYERLSDFQILPDGTAVGLQSGRGETILNFYDAEMNWKENNRHVGEGFVFFSGEISPDKQWIFAQGQHISPNFDDSQYQHVLLDKNFKKEKLFREYTHPNFNPAKIQDREYWVQFLAAQLSNINQTGIHVVFADNGTIYMAESDTYAVHYLDPSLNHQVTITKKYKPKAMPETTRQGLYEYMQEQLLSEGGGQLRQFVNDEVLRRAVDAAQFPPFVHPVQGLLAMGNDGFAVMRDLDPETGAVSGEIFNQQGNYLGNFELTEPGIFRFEGLRLIFKNGYAYAMVKTKDDENQVVRYKYHWQDGGS